jgi:hypothetical protein
MLARIATDYSTRSFGIACNEYTAVCVEPDGKAYVYGEYPAYDEFAYFIQANCTTDFEPETCVSGSPLTWDRNNEAIKVYKVPGTESGVNYFDLSDWETGSGGEWRNWTVDNGVFTSLVGVNPLCSALSVEDFDIAKVEVYPNPFSDHLNINSQIEIENILLYDTLGKVIPVALDANNTIDTSFLTVGIYFLKLKTEASVQTIKIVKK